MLQEVDLDAYDNVECQRTFQTSTLYDIRNYLTEGVMCAANGTTGGQDSCRVSLKLKLVCRLVSGSRRDQEQGGGAGPSREPRSDQE